MARAEQRRQAISAAVARIRAIADRREIDKAALAAIEGELLGLAAAAALFTLAEFPPPAPGEERKSRLYLLAQDPDGRFPLYAHSCIPVIDAPPHNHTTWAVIAGIEGSEENRFYERAPAGPRQTGEQAVGSGVAIGLLADELHSIHVHGSRPVLNFHMYGRALDQLHEREFWDAEAGRWDTFPAQEGIIDRREG